MRVLITGGAGFVGSCLALGLRQARPDWQVTALDNLRRRGSELNLKRLREAGIGFVHGDIRCAGDLEEAGPADLLLECSAEPSVLAGYTGSPRYVVDTNLCGTINCLEHARAYSAAVIFLSTSRVYPIAALNRLAYEEGETRFNLLDAQSVPGVSAQGISETFPLDGARSLYGATKLCSELVMQEYLDMYGVKGVINRCGILTGPWQMGKVDQGVVVLWAARHVFGGRLTYVGYGGHGKQVRDMLHVDDLLALLLHEIDHLDHLSGSVFNVGGGIACSASLRELTELCREITGNDIPIQSQPEDRVADIPLYISDCARVAQATNWSPRKDVRTILTEICTWLDNNRDMLQPILG